MPLEHATSKKESIWRTEEDTDSSSFTYAATDQNLNELQKTTYILVGIMINKIIPNA